MYPDDFVEEVKEEFRDREDIVEMAMNGRHVLGSFLAQEAKVCLDPEEVVTAFERGKEAEVLSAAKKALHRRILHRKWLQFMLEAVIMPDPKDVARWDEARLHKS